MAIHMFQQLIDTLKKSPKRIVFTEGTDARRSPRAKFYEEIIGALEAAIGLFPDTRTTESGRIDMPAAKALLARMYLYNEQWDEAADMASQVIGHYGLELCPSLKDLWADDKTNNEFIWTTEFTLSLIHISEPTRH